jgi:hypothetical protein
MMRQIVDSSFLETGALREYLAASSDNYAVVPDYVAMEAYKGDTLGQIYSRMAILGEYPRQVIVLKSTQEICNLRGRAAASQTPLIDGDQTRGFPEYCQCLLAAQGGDASLQQQLLENGRAATAHIDRMLLDMKTLADGIALMTKTYSAAELKILRRSEKPTPEMQEKLIQRVCQLAQLFLADHLSVTNWSSGSETRDTFVFRYALCAYLSILKRIEKGAAQNVKPEKLRNDVVDINVVAFATYFDGLLTTDKKAGAIYADARFLLREAFPVPPWRVRIVIALLCGFRAVRGVFERNNRD